MSKEMIGVQRFCLVAYREEDSQKVWNGVLLLSELFERYEMVLTRYKGFAGIEFNHLLEILVDCVVTLHNGRDTGLVAVEQLEYNAMNSVEFCENMIWAAIECLKYSLVGVYHNAKYVPEDQSWVEYELDFTAASS